MRLLSRWQSVASGPPSLFIMKNSPVFSRQRIFVVSWPKYSNLNFRLAPAMMRHKGLKFDRLEQQNPSVHFEPPIGRGQAFERGTRNRRQALEQTPDLIRGIERLERFEPASLSIARGIGSP